MLPDMTELQRIISQGITPESIRYGRGLDWRFFGDFNHHMYRPEPITHFVDEWEAKVAAILRDNYYGLWLLHGPRGCGKSGFAATTAFYFKHLYGRKIGSNYPLKPAFGDYRSVCLDDIKDQRERLNWLAQTGRGDWEHQDLESEGIWLPGMVILDDEFYQEVSKRNTGSLDNRELTDFNLQIRHFDVTFMGLAPDKEMLDTQRINNASLISTEVRCVFDVDGNGRQWIRGYLEQNETTSSGWQRVSGPPSRISYDVERVCNLWWSKGSIAKRSANAKGSKRPLLRRGRSDMTQGAMPAGVDDSEGWETEE